MSNLDERRNEVIEFVSDRLDNATDSRAARMVARYCQEQSIAATSSDIQDMANEAIRRRLIEKIKELRDQIIALNAKVNAYHQ